MSGYTGRIHRLVVLSVCISVYKLKPPRPPWTLTRIQTPVPGHMTAVLIWSLKHLDLLGLVGEKAPNFKP